MVRHNSIYIILFFTSHNEPKSDDKRNDFHTSIPQLAHCVYGPLMTSQSIADDATNASRDVTILMRVLKIDV